MTTVYANAADHTVAGTYETRDGRWLAVGIVDENKF